MRQEREDGLATVNRVVGQPWFGDAMVLVGTGYPGYVQWAVADRLPPQGKAMIPHMTEPALGAGVSLGFPVGLSAAADDPGPAAAPRQRLLLHRPPTRPSWRGRHSSASSAAR